MIRENTATGRDSIPSDASRFDATSRYCGFPCRVRRDAPLDTPRGFLRDVTGGDRTVHSAGATRRVGDLPALTGQPEPP
jgi:hypothetical protein